jgi:hypothetical protein
MVEALLTMSACRNRLFARFMVNQILINITPRIGRIDSSLIRDNLAHARCCNGAELGPMFFLLRCLFWLGLVWFALPLSGLDWRPDFSGMQKAAQDAATDHVKDWCLKDPATCAKNAAEAADLLGLLPHKGASQNTLQPDDLKPAWRGHQEAPRPARG